jgi:hypothetical protein
MKIKTTPMPTIEYRRRALPRSIHERAATLLGWELKKVQSYSFAALRDILRTAQDQERAAALRAEIDRVIAQHAHASVP